MRAKKPCAHQGCATLVPPGTTRCPTHDRLYWNENASRRGTAAQRGYGSMWRRARAAYLRQYPLCLACEQEGRTTAAEVVDHITPHRGNSALFWDRKNWQPLCYSHHQAKTARERIA